MEKGITINVKTTKEGRALAMKVHGKANYPCEERVETIYFRAWNISWLRFR